MTHHVLSLFKTVRVIHKEIDHLLVTSRGEWVFLKGAEPVKLNEDFFDMNSIKAGIARICTGKIVAYDYQTVQMESMQELMQQTQRQQRSIDMREVATKLLELTDASKLVQKQRALIGSRQETLFAFAVLDDQNGLGNDDRLHILTDACGGYTAIFEPGSEKERKKEGHLQEFVLH